MQFQYKIHKIFPHISPDRCTDSDLLKLSNRPVRNNSQANSLSLKLLEIIHVSLILKYETLATGPRESLKRATYSLDLVYKL